MEIEKLLETVLPKARIRSRLIDVVSYASDAGFYYLRPKAVVQPISEEEVKGLFALSQQHRIPLTFRTAGTSLSGQSITDGILVDLSQFWNKVQVEAEGELVRVQPGVIGAIVNAFLRKYKRKIGPDPASINSAMMGGILSNNASGMCCGVSKNSYHTTKYIRFILPNGKSYTTESALDYIKFGEECPALYCKLHELRAQVQQNPALHDLIRHKYKTKNTVGYSVNAFIDYNHPLDILAHLLIGAEGTLGFIAEAVLRTVPDYPAKSTALLYFPDIYAACQAIMPLTAVGAEAVELMDRASLRSIEHMAGVPAIIKTLPETAAALLVEFQGHNLEELQEKIANFLLVSPQLALLEQPVFTADPTEQALLWKVRKGMFPAVGAVRASGTTVILEDIAFPLEKLGDAILDLQALFQKHNYSKAIIFGHAKDGNIHFVVTQAFDSPSEIERYNRFLQEVVELVVQKYNGALKAEHGTGRNMAPFVETEWGSEIYGIMKALKETIDPDNLLNPGVIINHDKNAHIQNLKELPKVEEEVDKCMECGFCEHKCPSRNITLTPRRRIVVRRELLKLKRQGNKKQHKELLQQYQYDGLDTCAVDGLCATACPVDINTGDLVKRLRRESHSDLANELALLVAKNFKPVTSVVKAGLKVGAGVNSFFGENTLAKLTKSAKDVVPAMPLWSNQLAAAPGFAAQVAKASSTRDKAAVVYFPTCISRTMGDTASGKKSTVEIFISISEKAGVDFLIPQDTQSACCGQIFSSKGYSKAFAYTANETIAKVWRWTDEGRLPLVLDVTSCTYTLQHCRPVLTPENKARFDKLKIIDSIDYIVDHLLPRAFVARKKERVVLHPVCSLQKMGLETKFVNIARQLAQEVTVPLHAGCCGMAGDRGFLVPELTKSATAPGANEVKQQEYDGYYSSAKTCEMAMTEAVGRNYESIMYLLDECIAQHPGTESIAAKGTPGKLQTA
ncbi:FAD-binding and (Fe-S)-binding domain-containing protein [Pontibacter harenae]|uniref:FAD-binding and (Fe-S)-binding domain-containing protein n=1 Tax=Pontibacter harenae TaxID=2894083 RepID=UPI001E60F85D|nr:FAD-binding and (Fe-S)-binding domain-containing protein [Pontibacter harenae]MCC9167823.1 FAD-binding oxidoreductase [Pontibacter harenae]